jgi:hypothetical protein
MREAPRKVRSALLLAPAAVLLASLHAPAQEGDKDASKAALKELQAAAKLLSANRYEEGVARLEALVETAKGSAAAEKAAALLKDYGVGKEARVRLVERSEFHKRLRVKEAELLDPLETTLERLRKHYHFAEPYYTKRKLEFVVYDSQARYRKAGGLVTAAGHYSTAKADDEARELFGRVEWYYPAGAANRKDRDLSIQSSYYHECVHYLNAVHFAGALPPLFEEGLATHFTSRLNTESYQSYRTTDRLNIEGDSRRSLSWISKYPDFLTFVDADRGFGRGDESVTRWYSLCYAVIDFFEEGEIGGRRTSRDSVLLKLKETVDKAPRTGKHGRPQRLEPKPLLEQLVRELYGVELPAFHAALVARILGEYKQR